MRQAKTSILHALKRFGMFALARLAYRRRVRVLCYHGVWLGDGFPGDAMFMRPQTFAARLRMLRDGGYNVIPLEQAVRGMLGRTALPPNPVVITIDDGWYSTFAGMLPLLKRMQMPATIYCDTANLMSGMPVPHVMARYLRRIHAAGKALSVEAEQSFRTATDLAHDRATRHAAMAAFAGRLGIDATRYFKERTFSYMTTDELAVAARDGFSIQLHTHNHSLHDFHPEQVADEIRLNRHVLARILDQPENSFNHFCYPSGEIASGVSDVLRNLGIASATTLESGLAHPDRDPRLLPRITDGEHLSEIEFEADLCGLGDLLRILRRFASWPQRRPRPMRVAVSCPAPHHAQSA